MTDAQRAKVLVVAFDAAEPELIDRLLEQGELPNVAALRARAARARIRSLTDWFVAAPWPSFYTGVGPGEHGIYHYLPWNPRTMASQPLENPAFAFQPFWRDFQSKGLATVVIDAPLVYPPPGKEQGTELCGWCTHDCMAEPWVHPASVGDLLRSHRLEPIELLETQRPMTLADVERLVEVLNGATRNLLAVSQVLLRERPWDFALVSFTATHMGGHQLFSETSLRDSTDEGAERITEALRRIYVECDAALGQLLQSLPPDTTVLLMSLHGMEANTNRGELLPEMLRLILAAHGHTERRGFRLLSTLRDVVPRNLRTSVKERLPRALRDWLTGFWRTGGKDWSRTKAVALIPDLQGQIRINVRGREARGVVEPGVEYEALCERIVAGLRQFVDTDSGEPIVREVARADQMFPDGAAASVLPDILVNWTSTPCAAHRGEIRSPFGSVRWPTPGRNFDGRSGNHAGYGFLLAAGPGIEPGARLPDAEIVDLAPTLYQLLGLSVPGHMRGSPILGGETPRALPCDLKAGR